MTNINAPFKYTFPVEKAFIGEDGKPRLIGAATGPEVDLESQRVHPALIDKWIDQINTGQIEVIYDNWHKKDDVLVDLGIVEKAWKNESGHMYVQILLDEDNPVSQYIHKAARKGKQYGMSVSGKATSFVDEVVQSKMVRTITDGVLERIAHTTRPIWTPSFGTVLSKAIDEAAKAESATGDTEVAETTDTTETKVEKTEEVKTDSGAATNPETNKTPEVASGAASSEASDTEVEKAISADTKKDAKNLDKIVQQYQALGKVLQDAGLITEQAEGSDKESTEKTVEKSESTDSTTEVEKLQKSVTELTTLVTSLADRISDGTAPGVLRKSESVDPIAELMAVSDPIERLRFGLAAKHGEDRER